MAASAWSGKFCANNMRCGTTREELIKREGKRKEEDEEYDEEEEALLPLLTMSLGVLFVCMFSSSFPPFDLLAFSSRTRFSRGWKVLLKLPHKKKNN